MTRFPALPAAAVSALLLFAGQPVLAQSAWGPDDIAPMDAEAYPPVTQRDEVPLDAPAPAGRYDSYGLNSADAGAPEAAEEAPAPVRHAKPRKARSTVSSKAPPMSWDGLPAYDTGSLARLQQLRGYYQQIAASGGFGSLPPSGIGPGSKGAGVLALRHRLILEGDLQPDLAGVASWDPSLTVAVQRFQARNDLGVTGSMSSATRNAMAVSVDQRISQIDANIARLQSRPLPAEGRYVAVNLPSARVEAVQNGAVVRQYTAIVGRPGNESPQVDATISAININPRWTLPWSIIKKEIAPKVANNPGYLASQRMRVEDFKGNELSPNKVNWASDRAIFTVRQDAGAGNALGQLRIQMPNSEAVYMHDTPTKRLFSASDRFFSHGCVRVQGVNDLAAWLLGPGWDQSRIADEISLGQTEDLPVTDITAVHWTYMTAYVTADGSAHFRNDIYGLDKNGGSMGVLATATQLNPTYR